MRVRAAAFEAADKGRQRLQRNLVMLLLLLRVTVTTMTMMTMIVVIVARCDVLHIAGQVADRPQSPRRCAAAAAAAQKVPPA